MNKWSHPKLANLTTGGIIILMIVIGFFAYGVSEGKHNLQYQIHLQGFQKNFYNFTTIETFNNGTVITNTVSRDIIFQTTLTTKSLSAQIPIHVTAVSEPFDYISQFEFTKLPDSLTRYSLIHLNIHFKI